jgi:hypothetical protein
MNELISFDASGETAEHLAHYNAVSRAKELPVGKCYGFPVETFSVKLLADLVASLGVSEKKRFVVTEPNGHFVITRMPDDYDLTVWRKNRLSKIKKANDLDDQAEVVHKAVIHYVTNPWEAVKLYCVGIPKEMRFENVIPYCYLQRRLASVAIFKNDRHGPTVALKEAIKRLCELGFISELGSQETLEKFKSKSLAYQVNMSKIINQNEESV